MARTIHIPDASTAELRSLLPAIHQERAMCRVLGQHQKADEWDRAAALIRAELRSRQPKVPTSPKEVPCPRCKAVPGEGCNARTLGRHLYHRARVDAAEAASVD